MNRIRVYEINEYDSGMLSGRIVSQDEKGLFLSDQSGIVELSFDKDKFFPNTFEGDIVEVHFIKINGKNVIISLVILNSVHKNPVNVFGSPYFNLNKNDKALIGILKRKNIFFSEIRNFFTKLDFIEIHTPLLVESPGIETYIEPFSTEYVDHGGVSRQYYLPTSPEFSLKEAIMAGLENIFEITRSFRNNGEKSDIHRPEFFMLEWYRAYKEYDAIMDDCSALINHLASAVYGISSIIYKNSICDLSSFEKVKVKELFGKYGIDLDCYSTDEIFFKEQIWDFYSNKNMKINGDLQKDDLFFKFFLDNIEPELGFQKPTIVYEYPYEMAALSRRCNGNDLYAERFELYICGIEIANAFGELTDSTIQEENFRKTIDERNKRNTVNLKMPERFLRVLKYGLPPCSGIALGIERLFILFENLNSINDADLFRF